MDNPQPKRRRFRYSLRTLLVFVTIASAGFGWLGYKVRQRQRQRDAVAAILEMGGDVDYDYEKEWDGTPFVGPTPPGPSWLRNLLGDEFFADVIAVAIRDAALTDAELSYLQDLPQLKCLMLFGDQGQLTDSRLLQVKGLAGLEKLYLFKAQISDTGLSHLRELSNLKKLTLESTLISDAGLVLLQELAKLEELCLFDTRVTNKGCGELQKALPNLIINKSIHVPKQAPPQLPVQPPDDVHRHGPVVRRFRLMSSLVEGVDFVETGNYRYCRGHTSTLNGRATCFGATHLGRCDPREYGYCRVAPATMARWRWNRL